MALKRILTALALALATLPFRASAQGAEEIVRAIYADLAVDGLGLWEYTSPSRRHDYLTPRLAAVFDANDTAEEEPCIDFAPEIDAQDYDGPELVRSLSLATATDGDTQTVVAEFAIFGEPRRVVWSFVSQGDRLYLDDISGSAGSLAAVTCTG